MNLTSVLIISFFVISILGTLLHFTHGWFKNGLILHFFSAVNESTWEHMKMLVAPTIVVTIFQYLIFANQYKNLFNGVFVLLIIELISIPIIFEILKLILKNVHFAISIIIFYISIFLGILCEYWVLTKEIILMPEWLALTAISIVVILFSLFTFYSPKLDIFKDPISGKYGHK